MIGRMFNETLAKIAAFIIFIGFNVTFLPQFIMGAQGMPRRYFNYIDQFQSFHQVSTVGSYILGFGFVLVFYYLVKSIFTGEKAPANPWGSRALEWQVSSPPPHHNFDYTPVIINGPYDYHKPMEEFQLGLAESGNGHGTDVHVDEPEPEIQ
jgi:cytochrome c oxidase subunit 1